MSDDQSPDPMHVLLVEDNPGDVRLMKEGFADGDRNPTIHVVTTSAEALNFLNQRDEFVDAPVPALVLLDLNLPGGNGSEILTAMNEEDSLRVILIISLTGSESSTDVQHIYENGGNAHLTKPTDPEEFIRMIHLIEKFWLSTVQLPELSSGE